MRGHFLCKGFGTVGFDESRSGCEELRDANEKRSESIKRPEMHSKGHSAGRVPPEATVDGGGPEVQSCADHKGRVRAPAGPPRGWRGAARVDRVSPVAPPSCVLAMVGRRGPIAM
jgi:hypothetical protein